MLNFNFFSIINLFHFLRVCINSEKKLIEISTECKLFIISSNIFTIVSPSSLSVIPAVQFSSAQSLICVRVFATPWTAALQALLSITSSWSLPKLIFIESVMPSNHLILCRPLLLSPSIFPGISVFSKESALASCGQSIGVSASTSVLPLSVQDWSPSGWTGLISLQSKGLSRVFSNTTVQSISSLALSLLYSPTLTSIHDYWKNHSLD